jgi:hypothetical protein
MLSKCRDCKTCGPGYLWTELPVFGGDASPFSDAQSAEGAIQSIPDLTVGDRLDVMGAPKGATQTSDLRNPGERSRVLIVRGLRVVTAENLKPDGGEAKQLASAADRGIPATAHELSRSKGTQPPFHKKHPRSAS